MNPVLRYAIASQIAYLAPGAARAIALAEIGLTLVSESPDGRIYIAKDIGTSVAVWRGTDDVQDMDIDGDILMAGIPQCHAGFYQLAVSDRSWIISQMALDMPAQWIFTGHSLGAAEALIYAYWYRITGMRVFLYGSPKVGYSGPGGFCERYAALNITTTRVIHDYDIVPTLPLSTPLTPWAHPCPAFRLNDCGYQVGDPNLPEQVWSDVQGHALAEHHISTYVDSIKAYATRIDTVTA